MSAKKIKLNVKKAGSLPGAREEGLLHRLQREAARSLHTALSSLKHFQIKEYQMPEWFGFITAGKDDDFL